MLIIAAVLAPASPAAAVAADWYSAHFQSTVIEQGHARLRSSYDGANSLRPEPEQAATVTTTLFLGARLRRGTEVYVDPELTGGRGMSSTLGIAGFPNGEAFRVGNPQPTIKASRFFLRQVFGLGEASEAVPDGPNQTVGKQAPRRITLVAGKFGLTDYFDKNAYSDDPRGQFLNWSLMNSAAWDYAADSRGYTWGLMTEYREPSWAVRAAFAAMPKQANGEDMDRRIGRAHGIELEGEHDVRLGEKAGKARLLAYLNEGFMGGYDQAVANPGQGIDVTKTRSYAHPKVGLATSDDLALSEHLGAFVRLSWNDGRNESFVYTEVDSSQAGGLSWTPAAWGRGDDALGAALAFNELSMSHRRYLSDGGLGFLLGDGAMHYGPETILETYYRFQLNKSLALSPDAQLILNPGYNRDRGPAEVWGVRVHAEF